MIYQVNPWNTDGWHYIVWFLLRVCSPVSQYISAFFSWFYSYSCLKFSTNTSCLTMEILKTNVHQETLVPLGLVLGGVLGGFVGDGLYCLHKWNGTAMISLKETSQGATSNWRAIMTHSSTDNLLILSSVITKILLPLSPLGVSLPLSKCLSLAVDVLMSEICEHSLYLNMSHFSQNIQTASNKYLINTCFNDPVV